MAAMLMKAASKRQRQSASARARPSVPVSTRRVPDSPETEPDSDMSPPLTVAVSRSPVPLSLVSPVARVAKRSRAVPDSREVATTTLYNSLIPIFRGQATSSASQPDVVNRPGGCRAEAGGGGDESKDSNRDSEADTSLAHRAPAASSSSPSAGCSSDSGHSQVEERELDARTFAEWFRCYLAAPELERSRSYLYSDQQYLLLLSACSANKLGDMDIEVKDRKYLYNKMNRARYRRLDMIHRDSNDHADVGPVLVCWLNKTQRRSRYDAGRGDNSGGHQDSDNAGKGELSPDSMKRCVPVSQIEQVLDVVHIGRSGHRGQDATDLEVQKVYDGITRELVREYVVRCGICQMRQKKKYEAAPRPIITKQLGDRHQVDIIDFHHEPDGDFLYLMHVTDHWSRFRWGFTLTDRTAAQVAYYLRIIWMIHGPPKMLHCDNGAEFKGEVSDACRAWNVQIVNSAPHHPQSQGQLEKLNSVVKTMLRTWQEEQQTRQWAAAVPKIFLQMNTTVCSAIRTTPFELVFGTRARQDMNPICDPLFLDALMGDLNDVSGTGQRLSAAADDLTSPLAAAADLQRLSAPAAAAFTSARARPDSRLSDIGGRDSVSGTAVLHRAWGAASGASL